MGKNFCKIEKKWCRSCKKQGGDACCNYTAGTSILLNNIHRCPKREKFKTIRLKDLIKDVNIDEVMTAMTSYYEEQSKNRDGYEKVLNELKVMEAIKTDWLIKVDIINDDKFGSWPDVTGLPPYNRNVGYAMEFTPWNEWLGMNIAQDTLDNLDHITIVASCLYEMTWSGFTQEKIQTEKDKLFNFTEEVKQIKKGEDKV